MTRNNSALDRLRELREVGQQLGQVVGQSHNEAVPSPLPCPKAVGQEKPQNSAENLACPAVPSLYARDSGTKAVSALPSGTTVGTMGGTSSLPADVRAGLLHLSAMPTPRIITPKVWPEIVADALRLASEGWAGQAFALGWEPIQIFGWSPERDGVAVWLAGAAPMFTAESCTVRIGHGAYRCMDRRPMPDAVLLWELGK